RIAPLRRVAPLSWTSTVACSCAPGPGGSSAQSVSSTSPRTVARTRTLSLPHGSTTTVSPAPVQSSWCPLLRPGWSAGAITGSPSIRERGGSGGRQEDAHRRGPAFGPAVVGHEADLRGGLPRPARNLAVVAVRGFAEPAERQGAGSLVG